MYSYLSEIELLCKRNKQFHHFFDKKAVYPELMSFIHNNPHLHQNEFQYPSGLDVSTYKRYAEYYNMVSMKLIKEFRNNP